jgi:hypothetical protein
MKRLNLFSGAKPTLEDLNYDRDAKELHIKKRLIDLTVDGTGILKGILNEGRVFNSIPGQTAIITVDTMHAYIQGEKIEITESQDVTLDDIESEANIIYLQYQLKNSTDPQAIRKHYLTGVEHCVWLEDSFLLTAIKESLYEDTADKLKLGRVAVIADQLVVTHDYRTFLKISDEIMNTLIEGKEILFRQPAPPVPTDVRLTTGFEDDNRLTERAGTGFSLAYIKVEFGDKGTGTASGNTFTKITSQLTWTTNCKVNQYLTDQNGNSFKVISNTSTTLTLEPDSAPVSGNFWLGPNARGYRFIMKPLDPSTFDPISVEQSEITLAESPVKQEYIWHGLTPDIKYRVQVASLGGWYEEEQSNYSSPVEIIAGGPKQIPESCVDAIENLAVSAQDQGIKIVFDIKTAYQDKVAGTEVVWTDDDSEPDFDNITMSKLFTDRKTIFLPARFSTDKQKIYVKAKIRFVDKTSRHCTTPFSISATQTKKYIADLSEYMVNVDYLKLAVPEISAANFSWRNLRTVAKAGSQFTTITQALASIIDDQYYVVLTGPGGYSEDVDFKGKNVLLIGYGKVMIKGRIQNADFGKFCGLKNITVYNDNAVADAINIQPNTTTAKFVMDNVLVKGDHFTTQVIYICAKVVIKRSVIVTTAAIPGLKFVNNAVSGVGSSGHVKYCDIAVGNSNCIAFIGDAPLEVRDCDLKSGAYSIAQTGTPAVRVYNCVYQVAPNGTIDYGTASNVSNVINANIEIVPEDDFGSDA